LSKSVLVIEDHRDIAENIAEFLRAHDFTAEIAGDGITGLHLALVNRYDAILVDLMLPKLDGITLIKKLRDEGQVDTPTLILTARDQLDDKLAGFSAGADDYLIKPFSLLELEARLRALMRRSSGPATWGTRVLKVADIEYDPDTLAVKRAGQAVRLNRTTRRILTMLMRHTHRVVTREELEREIWGDNPPDGDVLRAHIYALRSAIDKPFDKPLLHTIHGVGYRLSEQPTE
jgi:DNA-binding response OmpR family regulator